MSGLPSKKPSSGSKDPSVTGVGLARGKSPHGKKGQRNATGCATDNKGQERLHTTKKEKSVIPKQSRYDCPQTVYPAAGPGRYPAELGAGKEAKGGATRNEEGNTYMYGSVRGDQVVKIYTADITSLSVEAIVNSVGCFLDFNGAVAKAIKQAATHEIERDCRKAWKDWQKPVPEAAVVDTTGGNLCNHIIHAVGPMNSHSPGADTILFQTFENCLQKAEMLRVRSLAIPAIGGGRVNMAKSVVGEQLCKAITRFCATYGGRGTLKEIHLVDRNEKQSERTNSCFKRQSEEFVDLAPAKVDGRGHASHDIRHPASAQDPTSERQSTSEVGDKGDLLSTHSPKGRDFSFGPVPLMRTAKSGDHGKEHHQNGHSGSIHDYDHGISRHDCHAQHPQHDRPLVKNASDFSIASSTQIDSPECVICFDELKEAKQLDCGHTFCRLCIDASLKIKRSCPVCGAIFGNLRGDQPKGAMSVTDIRDASLPGYEDCGVIKIDYSFPPGIQTAQHPHPGRRYHGTLRKAYLPDNKEGREVLQLLRKAFDAQLTFTIGQSVTTGRTDQVTWNDIHHKTSMSGGIERFGYPDPTYLDRVKNELAAKGIK